MSTGTRFHNFREGDRSEYLAVYLFSALGLTTQVPRQEDIGIDLICNLAEQESGIISYRDHFAVSVKSASTPRVILSPPESKESEKDYTAHFDWLYHLELPLLLAVVDKDQQSMDIYSTLPAWFVHHENHHECGVIELVPRVDPTTPNPDVGRPKDCGVDIKAGGRKRFEVDLGFPIVRLTVANIRDKEFLRKIKSTLRDVVQIGADSARFAQLGIPYFWWVHQTLPQGGVRAMAFASLPPKSAPQFAQAMSSLAPGLITATMTFRAMNRPDLVSKIGDVLKLLPPASIPAVVKEKLPEVFSPSAGPQSVL